MGSDSPFFNRHGATDLNMSETRHTAAPLPLISSDETAEKQRLWAGWLWSCRVGAFALLLCCCTAIMPNAAFALDPQVGPVTNLPLPRYASLKSDKVNLREGPSKDHRTKWIYQRSGLPVEIIAEYENWRRIRDSEGTEGWVLHSLLAGKRTVLVAPWLKDKDKPVPLFTRANKQSAVDAQLMPGVLAAVKSCRDSWCRITGEGFDGYIETTQVWGVYPSEPVD